MRAQPLASEPVTAPEMRKACQAMGGNFYMHRYPGVQHDASNPECWCGPLLWTVEQCRQMTLKDIQSRLDEFFCVH